MIPTVNIAPRIGWPAGATPTPAVRPRGEPVRRRARPSALALRAAERRRAGGRDQRAAAARGRQGHQGLVHEAWCMKRAGAGVPSANRITLLRDADGDGVAETRTVFLRGLNSPFGMALVGNDLYVANTDAVVRFPYSDGETADHARRARRSPTCRPARSTITGPRTSSPAATARKLYATVGSNSNVGRERHGRGRATAPRSCEIDRATGTVARLRLGPAQSQRHGLAAADRRAVDRGQRARRARQRPRARLPDLGAATAASTAGRTATTASMSTTRVKPQRPDLVAKAIVPDYALGPHTASLGLAFSERHAAAGALSRAARSSASTARGTASRAAATR